MFFLLPSCSITICILLFSLSLLSFCGLVLWGWGLWTDRVLIALSSLALPSFFDNNLMHSHTFFTCGKEILPMCTIFLPCELKCFFAN